MRAVIQRGQQKEGDPGLLDCFFMTDSGVGPTRSRPSCEPPETLVSKAGLALECWCSGRRFKGVGEKGAHPLECFPLCNQGAHLTSSTRDANPQYSQEPPHTLIRSAIIKSLWITALEWLWRKGILLHRVGGDVNRYSHHEKQSWSSSKTKHRVAVWSAVSLLGMYLDKTRIEKIFVPQCS